MTLAIFYSGFLGSGTFQTVFFLNPEKTVLPQRLKRSQLGLLKGSLKKEPNPKRFDLKKKYPAW